MHDQWLEQIVQDGRLPDDGLQKDAAMDGTSVERPRNPLQAIVVFAVLLCSAHSQAEVTAASPQGFVSEHALLLSATPERAYEALVDEIAAWWDAEHSYTGRAKNFSLEATAGGCFCERAAGTKVEHMRVVNARVGRALVMRGGLGPLQGMAVTGSMSFIFKAQGDATLLMYKYSVGGFLPEGMSALAEAVDQVQLGQLKRLQAYLQAGTALNQG